MDNGPSQVSKKTSVISCNSKCVSNVHASAGQALETCSLMEMRQRVVVETESKQASPEGQKY